MSSERQISMTPFSNRVHSNDMRKAYALIAHIDRVCTRSNIEYMMDGGMLVGSMLHHDRIPWDDDLDIYMRDRDREKAVHALSINGYVVTSAGHYSKLWSTRHPRVHNSRPWNWPFVDIGWLRENATHVWERRSVEKSYTKHIYPREWLFPITRRPYGPLVLSAPYRSNIFLNFRFGSNWSKTCVADYWDHKHEKWRSDYIGNRRDSVACDALDVNIVHRYNITNETHKEIMIHTLSGRTVHTKQFHLESVITDQKKSE